MLGQRPTEHHKHSNRAVVPHYFSSTSLAIPWEYVYPKLHETAIYVYFSFTVLSQENEMTKTLIMYFSGSGFQ
jgi:hypothetical protein